MHKQCPHQSCFCPPPLPQIHPWEGVDVSCAYRQSVHPAVDLELCFGLAQSGIKPVRAVQYSDVAQHDLACLSGSEKDRHIWKVRIHASISVHVQMFALQGCGVVRSRETKPYTCNSKGLTVRLTRAVWWRGRIIVNKRNALKQKKAAALWRLFELPWESKQTSRWGALGSYF